PSRSAADVLHRRGCAILREAREVLGSETTRVHRADRRRSGALAARSARTATGGAGNWLHAHTFTGERFEPHGGISSRSQGSGLYRGPERGYRVSLGPRSL